MEARPHLNATRCHACGRCIAVCPRGVLEAHEGQVRAGHPELCDACLACEESCPGGGIEVSFAIVWAQAAADGSDRA